ncbi:aspartate/glutamate racemase family protein [Rhodococcus koreensis]|uniref:aspartate/glutamate racemase family protein n=1 Tax=Rhodococcus koreensis TaxID=99653 RepID=UPI001980CD87|nr:aspartate/glutamate racemase family protein [Rhodococcus koreensis]QSE84975.1 hypothetical protein JWS14_40845 [Rhodococcus koreensis]
MTDHPVIAIVHSTTASIAPTTEAFAREMPQARLWNLLDDRLGADADQAGTVTPPLRRRMLDLIRHGIGGGADAVLMACSMYGDTVAVAEQLWTTPVFASDLDMMNHLARTRPHAVAVLASLETAAADSAARLRIHLDAHQAHTEIVPIFSAGAAAAAGDLDQLVKTLAADLDGRDIDTLCLAQYSLSLAADDLAELTGLPVVSPPHLAARAVRDRLESRP